MAFDPNYAPQTNDRIIILSANAVSGTFSEITPSLPVDWSVDYSVEGEVALLYSGASLPVELISFEALAVDREVKLTWETESELNNSHFEVEWSQDGAKFETIGTIEGNGTTNGFHSYRYFHTEPVDGDNYYRLRQVDFDGHFEYSDISMATLESSDQISIHIYPNPATDYLMIESDIIIDEPVRIFNLNGQMVREFYLQSGSTHLSIIDLPRGTYFVRMGKAVREVIVQ